MAVVLPEACSAVQVEDRSAWTPQEANKWFLTAWDGAFESPLSEAIAHCAYKKYQRDQVVSKGCTFHGLWRVHSFSLAERLVMNTGLSRVILRLSPSTPSILSLLLACLGRRRERTATVVLARRVATCWHDATAPGLAKTFKLQTCATQRKLRHRAMPTGGPKIDSGKNCFPLKIANQLASYFYTSPGPIRSVVAKQPS